MSPLPRTRGRTGDTSTSGPRKVMMRELLRLGEDSWAPRLRAASLVAKVDFHPTTPTRSQPALPRKNAGHHPETHSEPDRGLVAVATWAPVQRDVAVSAHRDISSPG